MTNTKSTPKAKSAKSKSNAGVQKVNLEQFSKALDAIPTKETKERATIYLYPDGFTKAVINSDKGKAFRNSTRKKRDTLLNNILHWAKGKKSEDMKKAISEWDAFYKERYITHDYAIASISQKSEDSPTLTLALQIIRESKGIK